MAPNNKGETEVCHTNIDTVVIWNDESFTSHAATKSYIAITNEGKVVLHVIQRDVEDIPA